jgi:hypothetical protein
VEQLPYIYDLDAACYRSIKPINQNSLLHDTFSRNTPAPQSQMNKVKRDASRCFRNKKKAHLKAKIEELETKSKINNIRDLYSGINDFNPLLVQFKSLLPGQEG